MNMAYDYIFVYTEVLVLCLAFSFVMLRKVTHDLGSNYEVLALKWMLRIYMIMMIADGFTQYHYKKVCIMPLLFVGLCYAVYQFLMGALAYLWLFYAEQEIGGSFSRSRRFHIIALLPLIGYAFICFGSIRYGWFFAFDESGTYHRGPLFSVQIVFSYAYFIFSTVHAFITAIRTVSAAKKRRLEVVASFLIAPAVGGFLQLVIGGYPLVAPSICISFLFIFVNLQGDMINHDALTGLNNRKSADMYIAELIPHVSGQNAFYLYMMDADKFKSINDDYGHVEGDRALKMIADALRYSIDEFHGFVARFGGDEFTAIIRERDIDDPAKFVNAMEDNLKKACDEEGVPYRVRVSMGYTRCASDTDTITGLIERADAMLYEVKKAKMAA